MSGLNWSLMREAAVSMAHRCGRHHDAEDIAQDALLGLLRSGTAIDPERQAGLAAVAARRRIVDRVRREKRAREARAAEKRMGGLIEYVLGTRDAERPDAAVAAAIDCEVLHLTARGLTGPQVAAALGIAEGTVKSRLHRVRTFARIGGAA